jgi:hypothetical protein
MISIFQPWFAAGDLNVLAVVAIAFIALLVWELIRERQRTRKSNRELLARERSRKSHWGYS